jgi:hypothetical protein
MLGLFFHGKRRSSTATRQIGCSYFSIDVAKLVTQPFCEAHRQLQREIEVARLAGGQL